MKIRLGKKTLWFSLKPLSGCPLFYHLNEAGVRVFQFGPLIVEICGPDIFPTEE